jgi:hypothetical protein
MLTIGWNALGLTKFGFGRGGEFFDLIVLLVVVCFIAWALARPSGNGAAKAARNGSDAPRS